MWRPDGFKELLVKRGIDFGSPIGEAFADAILEALKKKGKHTDGLAPTLSINVRPEQKGWLVFIPDKE